MTVAVITGVTGQDGAYLSQLLLNKGYRVVAGERRSSYRHRARLQHLGIENDIEWVDFELADFGNIVRVLETYKPDEIYNLAAQSFVGVSFEQPIMTGDVSGLGVTRLLEAIRIVNPAIKFYQASTSEMFGKVQQIPQTELTPFYPRSPYGAAKMYGHWITVNYREAYDIYACSGILFNHESPLRGEEFVTRKISKSVANIVKGNQKVLKLGNLDAQRDWGYAVEYVEGMYKMLQQDSPDDYVLATGVAHSVQDFVQAAFDSVKLNWQDFVEIDERYMRPAEVDLLIGDAKKAEEKLGWVSETNFSDLVALMVEHDLENQSDV